MIQVLSAAILNGYVITYHIRHNQARCIVTTAVCVSVCLSLTAFLHYCTHPDVTLGNGRDALLLCGIGRICNWCTGFVAMATYEPDVKSH